MKNIRFDFTGSVRIHEKMSRIKTTTYATSAVKALNNILYQERMNRGMREDRNSVLNGFLTIYYQGCTELCNIHVNHVIYNREYTELDAFGLEAYDDLYRLNPDSAGLPNYGKLLDIFEDRLFTREEFYWYYSGLDNEPDLYEVKDKKHGIITNILSNMFRKVCGRRDAIETDYGIYVYDHDSNVYWKDGVRNGEYLERKEKK